MRVGGGSSKAILIVLVTDPIQKGWLLDNQDWTVSTCIRGSSLLSFSLKLAATSCFARQAPLAAVTRA